MDIESNRPARRIRACAFNAVIGLALYVLSSGPILALAFWLREQTGRDQFYAVMWLYAPLFKLGAFRSGPLAKYIEWWVVDVFRTVGPG